MTIHINSKPHEVNSGMSVAELLSDLGVTQAHVAVELNLDVVPRARHAETILHDGDRLEIVTLVGGG
jgi:sulfur carrier protein